MKNTPLHAPPRYCGQCGMTLTTEDFNIMEGYDPFTGRKIPDRVVMRLACPQRMHDVWHRSGESWVLIA